MDRKVAIEYGFVGLGGAGGKLAEAFRYVGGYKVIAANISSQDLAKLKIDDSVKVHLDLGLDGAGKDMTVGKKAIAQFAGELHNAISEKMEKQYIMVCIGGGGGTGSGGATALVDICREHTDQVGCIVTLPKSTEGEKVRTNTAALLEELYGLASEGKISPLILIDNEQVADIHKEWSILEFWKRSNAEISTLFHQINLICAQDSEIHPFDPADYRTIMRSGRCLIFGSLDIPEGQETSIAIYMRENLRTGLLAKGFEENYTTSKMAGAILIGSEDVLGSVPMENLEKSFGVLNHMIGDGTVHRGIYVHDKIRLRVYSLIGNLPLPTSRMKVLSR